LEGREDVVIGFLDESSSQTNNSTRLWGFNKPTVIKNTTRLKANTMGFYAINGNSLVQIKEDSKTDNFCSFLYEVKQENPDNDILIVLDNFQTHKSRKTRENARLLGITLVYLPPYSPDLNPIEQIWKSIKRALSPAFYLTKGDLATIIQTTFYQITKTISYARTWITNILDDKLKT
jgi:putative transposase